MVNITELKFDAAGLIPAIVQDADTRVYEPGISHRDRAFRKGVFFQSFPAAVVDER